MMDEKRRKKKLKKKIEKYEKNKVLWFSTFRG